MAASESAQGQPRPADGAVRLEGVERVVRAAGDETTGRGAARAQALVATHQSVEGPGRRCHDRLPGDSVGRVGPVAGGDPVAAGEPVAVEPEVPAEPAGPVETEPVPVTSRQAPARASRSAA